MGFLQPSSRTSRTFHLQDTTTLGRANAPVSGRGPVEHRSFIYPFLILGLNGHHSLIRVEKIGRAKLPSNTLCQHGPLLFLPAENYYLAIRHYPHSRKPESVFTLSDKTLHYHREPRPTFCSSNRAYSQKRRPKPTLPSPQRPL